MMSVSSVACDFPLFRAKFFSAACWSSPLDSISSQLEAGLRASGSSSSTQLETRTSLGKVLTGLDLTALQREDGPPTELQARREKFTYFEKHCSEVADGLYIGSDAVAKSRQTLKDAHITHVINCVGFLYPSYFKDELSYKVLYLQDVNSWTQFIWGSKSGFEAEILFADIPGEDINCVLHDVFNFIEEARQTGGRVLIHCSQGVSRSATLGIAYLMWKLDQGYDEVFQAVKAIRGVANPNIGFTCQLLNWQKRRTTAPDPYRVYRIAPHSPSAPLFLLPKTVSLPQYPLLDPRGAFLVQTPKCMYVWQGRRCPAAYVDAALQAADGFVKYENVLLAQGIVQEGKEADELLSLLGTWSAEEHSNQLVEECAMYSKDYQMWEEAVALASQLPSSAPNSSRSCKTPRQADDESGNESPNHRSRKMRKGEIQSSPAGMSKGSNRTLRPAIGFQGTWMGRAQKWMHVRSTRRRPLQH